jgi:formate C-acetyltransferase
MFDSAGSPRGKYSATIRTINLKRNIEAMIDAGVRKTVFYHLIGESLRANAGKPMEIRRALAFEHLLDNVRLDVHPYELIGGSLSGMWPVDPGAPGYEEQYAGAEALIEAKLGESSGGDSRKFNMAGMIPSSIKMGDPPKRFALMGRDHYDANIDFRRMQDIIKRLEHKYGGNEKLQPGDIAAALENYFQYNYGEDQEIFSRLPWIEANHIHLNYEKVICKGYGALLALVEDKLSPAEDSAKKEFYTACRITLEASIRYIRRYARAFLDAAETETNKERAAELEEIGRRLERLSTEKAESFKDAMQLMWITHTIAGTQLGNALSFGRFDQYMFPFYDRDIKSGGITHEEVEELLCCMFLKVNEPKMRTVQSLTLGGVTPDGKDGTNELTREVLRASRLVRLPYPNIALRVCKDLSPGWVYDEAVETIKCGFGMPMLMNDDMWIPNLVTLGYTEELARDYYNMGCVEMLVQNKGAGWYYSPGGKMYINYAMLLQEVLDSVRSGERTFYSFDAFYEAALQKIRDEVRSFRVRPGTKYIQNYGCDPWGSVFMDGCLESGKDMFQGGTELAAHLPISGLGLGTAVDSLAAIKTVVFDEKRITLDKLIEAAANNFRGEEPLRQYILNRAPHFGNDIGWVDDMAAELFKVYTTEVFKLNDGTIPEKYISSFFSYTTHVSLGEITPATCDGRLKGAPLSDNIGPSQGRDTEGPTKLINSILKYDYRYLNGANATNIKVSPNLFITEGGTKALKNLLLTYLREGGPQIQVNFVKREDLLDAQINPMKHRDIVVRIAGFCEYFIFLDAKQQDEIIARTEHEA